MKLKEDAPATTRRRKRKYIQIILFLSAALHVLLLLIFFSFEFQKKMKAIKALLKKLPPPTKRELPASLKPRKSNFGTFVFYEQEPQIIPKKLPEQQPEQKEAPPVQPQKSKVVQKKKPPTKKLVQKKKHLKQRPAPIKPKAPKKKLAQKKTLNKSLLDKIQKIKEKQAQLASLEKQKKELKKQIKRRQPKKKKKRNIIAMTRGFIENIKHKGNDWLERKGDDNKRPSFEELKYLSYEQRINWQLQSSWKRHFARGANAKLLQGKAIIDFTLDAHGNIIKLQLLQSSGHKELDDVILESTKRAAPFPPLPKHFNSPTYSTGRIIHVQARTFGF